MSHTAIVYRQDRAAVARLGREFLKTCAVAEWQTRGKGKFAVSFPRAWFVPCEALGDIIPITLEEADERRARRVDASRRGYMGRHPERFPPPFDYRPQNKM